MGRRPTRRNEELALERLQREDESARVRAEEEPKMRFEASQEAEQARMVSGEALSAAQYERDLTLQKLAEDMKAKTAKVRMERDKGVLFVFWLVHQDQCSHVFLTQPLYPLPCCH